MPIVLNVDSELKIILVKATDLVEVADLTEAIESFLTIEQYHGLNKVIIDATSLEELPSTTHLKWFASEL